MVILAHVKVYKYFICIESLLNTMTEIKLRNRSVIEILRFCVVTLLFGFSVGVMTLVIVRSKISSLKAKVS